jgi:hypothetical protein
MKMCRPSKSRLLKDIAADFVLLNSQILNIINNLLPLWLPSRFRGNHFRKNDA